jgi:hypothetical protein
MRTTSPSPGVVLVGTYGAGGKIRASVIRFIYGSDPEQVAAARAPAWQDWVAAAVAGDSPP